MKKVCIFLIISLINVFTIFGQNTPFSKGVNLTGWFEATNAHQIEFTKYTRQDLINIKNLGCDVFRLPIKMHDMTSGAPDYTIDPLLFYLLDQVVNWAEELGINIILDNHTIEASGSTPLNIDETLIPVWKQMAAHYKNRSNLIFYEILNEPQGITDAEWSLIQQDVIDAIRTIDEQHTIIVGPANWNDAGSLQHMPVFSDTNLIYTFHFYDPHLFTHQGAGWITPSLEDFTNLPFPYNQSTMPAKPAELAGTWLENQYDDYATVGTVEALTNKLDMAVNFKTARNVPLFCGELGVLRSNCDEASRINWYEAVCSYLTANSISWTMWDYQGIFGLFKKNTAELYNHDINVPLCTTLGLTAPAQSPYVKKPDTTGFDIYNDYLTQGHFKNVPYNEGSVDFYSNDTPTEGQFCIKWSNFIQYSFMGIYYRTVRDLSYLADNNYALDFWVRGDTPGTNFDIRFIDNKTVDQGDHPWRMSSTINESYGTWDGAWRNIRIPLSEFSESGSFDGQWYPAQGDFDWSMIERIEIVAENQDLTGANFWFDDIRIVPTQVPTSVSKGIISKKESGNELFQNYPNPLTNRTFIDYQIGEKGPVSLKIYNSQGTVIALLVDEIKTSGRHTAMFETTHLPAGIYFYRMETKNGVSTKRMVKTE